MCREASAAKRIISTAPIAKFGAMKTLAPRRVAPARAGSKPVVPIDDVDARPRRQASAFASAVSGVREVDDDVGVAEDVLERRSPAPGRRGR